MQNLISVGLIFCVFASITECIGGRRSIFLGDNGENIVDLTHTLTNESYVLPSHGANLKLTPLPNILPFYSSSNRMELAEHGGTHIDAINHFVKGGMSVAQIPLTNLMGRGVLIDVTRNGQPLEGNVDITVQDVLNWEAEHGRICCRKEIVLFRTGLGQFYESDPGRYVGSQNLTDLFNYKFPGIHPDLATFLTTKRKVRVVGTDTISTDTASRISFQSHRILQAKDVVLIENLANLDKLIDQPANFHVVIMPMKLEPGTGVPTRVVAIKDEMKRP